MINRLKNLRADTDFSQKDVAEILKVNQSTYQRWESGAVAIPANRLGDLAELFGASPGAIYARHAPITVGPGQTDPGLVAYGEITVHFAGGGAPLKLSISEGAHAAFLAELDDHLPFATVTSLANERVAIRKLAIAEITVVKAGYDGPGVGEDPAFPRFTGAQIPDRRDWAIIAALARRPKDLTDYAKADVARVVATITLPGGPIDPAAFAAHTLVSAGERMPDWIRRRERIYALATDTIWQLSSGVQRRISDIAPDPLRAAFIDLMCFQGDAHRDGELLRLDDGLRTHFIRATALDYVSVPLHAYYDGGIDDALLSVDDPKAYFTKVGRPECAPDCG